MQINNQTTPPQPQFGKFSKETLEQIMTTPGVFNKIGENKLTQDMFNFVQDHSVTVKNNGKNLTVENCVEFIKSAAYKLLQLDNKKQAKEALNNKKINLIKQITDIDLDIEAKKQMKTSYMDELNSL